MESFIAKINAAVTGLHDTVTKLIDGGHVVTGRDAQYEPCSEVTGLSQHSNFPNVSAHMGFQQQSSRQSCRLSTSII